MHAIKRPADRPIGYQVDDRVICEGHPALTREMRASGLILRPITIAHPLPDTECSVCSQKIRP